MDSLTSITLGVPDVDAVARYYEDFGLRRTQTSPADGGEAGRRPQPELAGVVPRCLLQQHAAAWNLCPRTLLANATPATRRPAPACGLGKDRCSSQPCVSISREPIFRQRVNLPFNLISGHMVA
jgi:hypothetical protein